MLSLNKLVSTALGVAMASVVFSMAHAEVINVAITGNSPPMLFSKDGKIVGVEKEIFDGFCNKKTNCTANFKEYTFSGMLGALKTGQADMAFSMISVSKRRLEQMSFSEPYYENSFILVSMKQKNIKKNDKDQANMAWLKGLKIGYPRGMIYSQIIKNEYEPKGYSFVKDARLYTSYNEVMTDLKNGNIDLAFTEEPALEVFEARDGYKGNLVKQYTVPATALNNLDPNLSKLAFAFPKNSKLQSRFNEYMKEKHYNVVKGDHGQPNQNSEEVSKLVEKWSKQVSQ
jgi:polar amino acid transport system substrate-binding protein